MSNIHGVAEDDARLAEHYGIDLSRRVGMSLRDWIALQALIEDLSGHIDLSIRGDRPAKTISKLDLAWEAVNALGGAATSGVAETAYNTAIGRALAEIEKLGGKDPAPARAAGAVEIGDGGPAFPLAVPVNFQFAENGMSLRDWFAGQALIGDLSGHSTKADRTKEFMRAANRAYALADAMLAERGKR